MARQTILWTVLPYGRVQNGPLAGRRRVTVVVSPRLRPETEDEQRLKAFPEFLDWPQTLSAAKFALAIGPDKIGLEPLDGPDAGLWSKLFGSDTPVAGFKFTDMSAVNLRSFAVRSVLGFIRRSYGRLAVQAASNHPTLLPWRDAHPDLKGMLSDLGTRTHKFNLGDRSVEVALPGFSRFFDEEAGAALENRLEREVFSPDGIYRMDIPAIGTEEQGAPGVGGAATRRTLPAEWRNPRPGGPGAPLSGAADAALMDQFANDGEYAFYQANRFYRRNPPGAAERTVRRPSFKDVPASPTLPENDFHRMVASYGEYPRVLRALGLAMDFALDDDGPIEQAIAAGGGEGAGLMALDIAWSNGRDSSGDTTPRTAWQADKARFVTRPRGQDLARGLLALAQADDSWGTAHRKPGRFDVYQVDPDGAALKTVGFALTAQGLVARSLSLRQADGEVTYTTGDRQAVAALRSGGLGVSRHDRAAQVAQDAAAAALKNQAVEAANGDKVVFFAEDVLRGYRVDVAVVKDDLAPGDWRSLCAREGAYRLTSTGETLPLPTDDEGHVSGASTTSGGDADANPDDHYLHESLFRWTGWSLCAPRPGLTLRAKSVEGTGLQAEEPTRVEDVASDASGIAATFHAPKRSLPRLRFGSLYRFRARVADIAGNSLSLTDPTLDPLEQASDAVGYWRFEPIDPPAMAPRARFSEGESLERMIIRSNHHDDTAAYLTTADFASAIALPASQDFDYAAENERHLVPPKASQQQCEQHGLFDPYFSDPLSIRKGYAIAAREAGTLYDAAPGAVVELVTPQTLTAVASTATVPPDAPGPDNPTGDRLTGGQYVIHREAALETPYLPDPAAAGVALRAQPGHALPGVSGEMTLGPSCVVRRAPNEDLVILVANGRDWPHSAGFRLILAERPLTLEETACAEAYSDDGAPKWDEDARTLTLFVAKGRIVRLFYASFAHPDLIGAFGLPRWTATDAERKFVTEMALMGAHWMLTPFRALTLVHATQQPVCPPVLENLSVTRDPGAHNARILCRTVRLHGPSTGKFEIEAEWREWIDDLEKSGPEIVSKRGQLGEIPLSENHADTFTLSAAVGEQVVDPARPRARGDVHDLGDARFRLIRYRARATTRFREYLPPSIYAVSDLVTRLGPVATGPAMAIGADDDPGAPVLPSASGSDQQSLVRASAPPDDPRVLYVAPTFRWRSRPAPGGQESLRQGNGLRVWIDRPWFSSGDGELLGVVLFGDGARFTDIPAPMQSLVTQWGMDPLWDTALPKTRARVTDFGARLIAEQVPLQERPADGPVTVVGHRVRWDAERRLWRCDVELDPGAGYMPFVRLALVRLQPNAAPHAKISKVVLAEFAQILPRRRAVLSRSGAQVSVRLHGPAPTAGPMKFPVDSEYQDISFNQGVHESGRNRAELVLQVRDPDIDSDLAWRDATILGAATVGDGAGGQPGGIFTLPAVSVSANASPSVQPRRSAAVRLPPVADLTAAGAVLDRVFVDPAIWEVSASLPDTQGAPARLMLREFERYYTDRTVPEQRAGAQRRRRVIEERLVYATIFDL